MLPLLRRNASSRLIIVTAMIIALLMAQGLRICVHEAVGASSTSSGLFHLETNLMADDGDGTESPGWHMPLSIALKQLGTKFEFLTTSIALLILLVLQVVGRLLALPVTAAPPTRAHALRPPLRAPPL